LGLRRIVFSYFEPATRETNPCTSTSQVRLFQKRGANDQLRRTW